MIYKILKGAEMCELEREVNELLAEGWLLQGGISVYGQEKSPNYYQAMTNHNKVYSGE